MGTAPDPSALLRNNKARILKLWERRVRDAVPTAKRTDAPHLLNALPDLLDRLATSLSNPSRENALEREKAEVAHEHGRQRAELPEYSLDQVIFEYQLLREVLLQVLEEEQPMPTTARGLIIDILLLAIRNAASEFARVRDEQNENNLKALSRANQELDRRVQTAVAEFRGSEERFRQMVDVVKDYALFTVDPKGCIMSWNEGCRRMKGYTNEEAIGRHFSILYPEEGNRRDEPMGHLRAAAAEGRYRGEGLRIRKNGELFLADVSITPIHKDSDLIGYTKVVADLTERNLLIQERDLSRSDAMNLRIEAEYRERFVATLTHDLRSPLSAAMMSAELIAASPDANDPLRTLATRISKVLKHAEQMIGDLLDASRLHAGEALPVEFEPFDLAEIAGELCEELTRQHGPRFVVRADGPTTGVWSPKGLRRVLDNLLSNALKYGDPDRSITVRLQRVDERVLVSVHNHGTIISVEEQAKLFQPFHRTHMGQTSGKQGWGIGLTIVRGITEAHGGVVMVGSYPKEGTTVTIDIPVDARNVSDQGAG